MAIPPQPVPDPPGQTLLRLSLSALDQASADPSIWRRAEVHQAVLVSGLTVFVAAISILRRDLEQGVQA
jgi:hypothetical protein